MKKIICIVLSILMLFSMTVFSASAAIPEENEIMPLYNNTGMTDSLFYIDENGLAYVMVSFEGYSNITTGATITSKIQKKVLGLFWSTVDIGTDGDVWVDNVSGYSYIKTRTHQLGSTGTYRAVINYTVYGTGGAADEIEDVLTYKYS